MIKAQALGYWLLVIPSMGIVLHMTGDWQQLNRKAYNGI